MTDTKISWQLAKFNKWEQTVRGAKATPAITVTYTRIDGDVPKEQTVTYLKGSLNDGSKEIISKLAKGDVFVVVKETKANPQNPSSPFWNLKEFLSENKWEERPVKTYNKFGGNKTYDDTGVKVGAARNQAIAFLAATKGTNFTLDDVDLIAYQIIDRQAAQEATIRAKKDEVNNAVNEQQNQQAAQASEDNDEVPF
jgi:hypothetical protein